MTHPAKEKAIFDRHYSLIELLGCGEHTEVWLARDNMVGVDVVIKMFLNECDTKNEGIELLAKEFSLVFAINHTNLLRPTHFDSWENIPYIILPYCRNGNVNQYMKHHKTMNETDYWYILHDISTGLAYLHSQHPPIIHQDIKPDNILVSDDGQCYMITDFGISIRMGRNEMRPRKKTSGTVAYMGPERFKAGAVPIKANDIWSLGATMYEIITNNLPFGELGGATQTEESKIIWNDKTCSDELIDLVNNCLSYNPWDRPVAQYISEYAGDVLKKRQSKESEFHSATVQNKRKDSVENNNSEHAKPSQNNNHINEILRLIYKKPK